LQDIVRTHTRTYRHDQLLSLQSKVAVNKPKCSSTQWIHLLMTTVLSCVTRNCRHSSTSFRCYSHNQKQDTH